MQNNLLHKFHSSYLVLPLLCLSEFIAISDIFAPLLPFCNRIVDYQNLADSGSNEYAILLVEYRINSFSVRSGVLEIFC